MKNKKFIKYQMTNIKYQVHLFPGWCLVHGGRRNLWTQSSPLGLPMRLKGVIKEIIILIKWKSITTWKSDCEWLLTLVLHQMTRNSPKFVEVVGAVLITSGFLILGESILYHLLGCFNFKQTLGFMFIADVAQPHPNNKI